MSSSIGMMKFPIYGKIKNVPNHQPGICGMLMMIFAQLSDGKLRNGAPPAPMELRIVVELENAH